MARFCGHCGSRLDEATGLCPVCDARSIAQLQGDAATEIVQGQTGSEAAQAKSDQPEQPTQPIQQARAAQPVQQAQEARPTQQHRRKRHTGVIVAAVIALIAMVVIAVGGTWLYKVRFNPVSRQLALGERYLLEEDYEQAVIAFNKVIELNPKSMDGYGGLMDAYLNLDDVEGAFDTYMTAMGVDGLSGDDAAESLDTYRDRIETALNDQIDATEDVEEQIRLLEMLAALCPDHDEYHEALEALQNPQEDVEEPDEDDDAEEASTVINEVVRSNTMPDGTDHIRLEDGTDIALSGDVFDAFITADRQHVVVLLRDGTLYITDKEQSYQSVIDQSATYFCWGNERDDGFFYKGQDDVVRRVMFGDNAVYELGVHSYDSSISSDFLVADESTTVLWTDQGKGTYILTSGSTERTYITDAYVTPVGIRQDGTSALFYVEESDADLLRVTSWENGTQTEYELYGASTYDLVNRRSPDSSTMILEPDWNLWDTANLCILWLGQDPVVVPVERYMAGQSLYAIPGDLDSGEADMLYIATCPHADTLVIQHDHDPAIDLQIHGINIATGEDTVMLSDVREYEIVDHHIVYVDMQGTLYTAIVEGTTISEAHEVGTGADYYFIAAGGEYIYYYERAEGADTGSLYCYLDGEDASQFIASDVDGSFMDNQQQTPLFISSDGRTVLYYRNVDHSRAPATGTLMMWEYEDTNPASISEDVLLYDFGGNLEDGMFSSNDITYYRFVSNRDGESLVINVMRYDGVSSTLLYESSEEGWG